MNQTIGYVVGGGLKEGLRVRLTVSADSVQEGSFVVCESGEWRYYGLITDLQLGATDPRFADEQSGRLQPAISQALLGKTLFTTMAMYTTLMLHIGPADPLRNFEWQDQISQGQADRPAPRPVKTVPAHHAPVRLAESGDVDEIFTGSFSLGTTIEDPHHPVKIDLERLVKRSSGIFGATGTGKSFLTRMILAGVMHQNVAAALVFDMHNEYGLDDKDSDRGTTVPGMKGLFGSRVQVAALGAGATVRGKTPDFTLEIGLGEITSADILMLSGELNLNETAGVVMAKLQDTLKKTWFSQFMRMVPGATEEEVDEKGRSKQVPAPHSVELWALENNIHPGSAAALHRKLEQIHGKPYVVEKDTNPVRAIIDKLENGRHVVLSFGEHESDLDYLLVSNILTRRIRDHWVALTNAHKSEGTPAPKPLMICIEEAHKLLSPHLARQTAFGTIARELRKYFVTLLVVDQRPSAIDDEVMSQLGTRITGWLGDEDDIRAVLSGLAGRDQLRGMLARLQEKEEVLLLGWGVKMPIPLRSRRYDESFFAEMRGGKAGGSPSAVQKPRKPSFDDRDDLFG
jgi:hypothetical protein